MRLFLILMIAGIYIFAAIRFAGKTEYILDLPSVFTATVVIALVGGTWSVINGLWNTVRSPYRPQRITLETRDTPFQITTRALGALVKLILVISVLVFFLFYLLKYK